MTLQIFCIIGAFMSGMTTGALTALVIIAMNNPSLKGDEE